MTDDHLSLDELAELDEGLLGSERGDALRAHLAGCAQCQANAAAITATRSMLSDLPAVTMPADIRARIDQAIAAEADAAAVPTQRPMELVPDLDPDPRIDAGPLIDTPPARYDDPGARSADVMPAPGTVVRPRFGRPTAASASAAAAVVLVIGAIVVAHFHHGKAAPAIAANSIGQTHAPGNSVVQTGPDQPKSVVKTSTGLDYTSTNFTTTVQGVLARGQSTGVSVTPNLPAPNLSSSPSTTNGAGGDSAGSTVAGGGSNSSARRKNGVAKPTLGKKQVGTHAPSSGGIATSSTPPTPSYSAELDSSPIPASLRPLAHSQPRIIACGAAVSQEPNAVPEAVDFARWTGGKYHNAPSAIFIFRGETPSTVSVFVTNPTCRGNNLLRYFSTVTLSD